MNKLISTFKKINKQLILLVLILCSLIIILSSYDSNSVRKTVASFSLDDNWVLSQDGLEDVNIKLPYEFKSNTSGEYSFKTTIPDSNFTTQLLTFTVYFKDVWVYVDGNLIYEHVTSASYQNKINAGTGEVRVILPANCDGKTLEVVYNSIPCTEKTYFSSPTIMDATANIFTFSIDDILYLFIMFSFLFISLILIIFYILNYKSNKNKNSFLYLSFFFMSISIWALCYTRLVELWMKDWNFTFNLEYIAFYSIIMSVWLLYTEICSNNSIIATGLKYLSIIFYLATLLCNITLNIPFSVFLPSYHIFALITFCILPYEVVKNFKSETVSYKIFSAGIICIIIAAIVGLGQFYLTPGQNSVITYLIVLAITGLLFIVSVVVRAIDSINNHFHYAITSNQKIEYARYETIFCNAGNTFFDWNVAKDFAYLPSNFNSYFNATITNKNFSKSFMSALSILKEDNKLMEAVKRLHNDSNHEIIEGSFQTENGETRYFTINLSSSFDSNGNKTHIFGLIKDSTESTNLENEYNKQSQYIDINRLLYDNILEADIENDVFIGEQSKTLTNVLGVYENISYTEGIKVISEKLTHPDYADGYRELFSKERLLSLWADGVDQFSAETYELGNNGNYEWLQLNVMLYRSNETNSICIISYAQNITSMKTKELELVESSTKDSLSQLLNKGASKTFISNVLENSSRNADSHALLIIDVDEFKTINDTLGHAMGDQVIVEVSKKIKSLFRDDDIIGRFGGDEFIVLIKNIRNIDFLQEKCKELNREVNIYYNTLSKKKRISLSIGLACYPQHGSDYDTLFANADKAMYMSKNKGRNTFTIYSEDLD